MTMLLAGALVLLAGAAIGATAIGGVIVVPALAGVAGVPVGEAIAASTFAFLLTGLVGAYGHRGSSADALSRTWPLHVAALAGAACGAMLVHVVPSAAVRGWVALLALGSGLYALAAPGAAHRVQHAFPRGAVLVLLGLLVGCGSALSGTGGPVLLLPALLLLRSSTVASVAVAQVVQLPIALAGSVAHGVAGRLDLGLGAAVGAALMSGAWVGLRLARRADPSTLRRGTALALIATGLWYGLS